MHELGILISAIETVEAFAKKNGVTNIQTLVLQIGELSAVVPKYLEDCYPAAVAGTMLQETALKIEILPGNGICKSCSHVFNLIANHDTCPDCGSTDWEILCGKEFLIKEIVAC